MAVTLGLIGVNVGVFVLMLVTGVIAVESFGEGPDSLGCGLRTVDHSRPMVASPAWHPFTTAAGASRAVFGLYGGVFGYLLLQRNSVAPEKIEALSQKRRGFPHLQSSFGFAKGNVDVAVHLGGLATGFVAGCALSRPVPAVMASAGLRRSMVVLAAGTVMAMAGGERVMPVFERAGVEEVDNRALARAALVKQIEATSVLREIGKNPQEVTTTARIPLSKVTPESAN